MGKYKGTFLRSNEHIIKNQLKKYIDNDLLKINIRNIREEIESNSWIKSVLVSRDFPDTLVIDFLEYEPLFFWNAKYVIGINGEVFQINNTKRLKLPIVTTDINITNTIYTLYVTLTDELDKLGLTITSVSIKSDILYIHTNKHLIITRYSSYKPKLNDLIDVYEEMITKYNRKISTIDLRYSTGFAVK